jgi:hypothetical protein
MKFATLTKVSAAIAIVTVALTPLGAHAMRAPGQAESIRATASRAAGIALEPATTTNAELFKVTPRTSAHVSHFMGKPGASQVQIVSVLDSPDASETLVFDLASTTMATDPVTAVSTNGGGLSIKLGDRLRVGAVDAPWAKDANGKSLPTHYQVQGQTIRQVVDFTGAAFPVVADPKITYGWGVYLGLWGAEIKAVISALAVGGFAGCTFVNKLPTALSKVAGQVCTLLGLTAAKAVFQLIVSTFKDQSKIQNYACYQRKILPPEANWYIVGSSNCQ